MDRLRRLFSRSTAVRDADVPDEPGSSLLAIKRYRDVTGCDLRAHVYRYGERSFLVTSIMWIPGSFILETGEPSVLAFDAPDAELGRAACEHILRHEAREPLSQRDAKRTDWAIFKASGAKSVSGFESQSSRVSVETKNWVLELEAAPVCSHSGLCVKGITQARHDELGAMIRKTLAAADVLRQAGMV